MRWLGLLACITACLSVTSTGGDDDGSGGSGGSGTSKVEVCGDARDCTAADQGCESYPYESLPERCVDICYRHECCASFEGAWSLRIYDCARPIEWDGGIDYDGGDPGPIDAF
jgi:hypothetical protein